MVTLHHRDCKVGYIQQIIINETLIQIFKLGSIRLGMFESQSECSQNENRLEFLVFHDPQPITTL